MNTRQPRYLSGEMILRGDIIKYHGEAGAVEFAIQEMSRRLKTMHKTSKKIMLSAKLTATHSIL